MSNLFKQDTAERQKVVATVEATKWDENKNMMTLHILPKEMWHKKKRIRKKWAKRYGYTATFYVSYPVQVGRGLPVYDRTGAMECRSPYCYALKRCQNNDGTEYVRKAGLCPI